jgi:hypothetical protein
MIETSTIPIAQSGAAGSGTGQRPRNGFSLLLQELLAGITGGESLKEIVRQLLTFGERQSFAFGLRSLTRRQTMLLDLMEDVIPEHLPGSPHDRTATLWHIGIWDYGRIFLSDSLPPDRGCTTLANFPVPEQISQQLTMQVHQADLEDARFELEVEEFFRNLDDIKRRDLVSCLWHGLDHIDPVLIYVNNSTFTNFDVYNNLMSKPDSLLQRLADSQQELRADEKRFAFCFYWGQHAGLRGEEFNGVQLTPALLGAHFSSCLQEYAHILDRSGFDCLDSIAGKAQCLRTVREEIGRDFFPYRAVNGLNFHKEERFAPRAAVKPCVTDLPRGLHQYIEDTYNLRIGSFSDLNDLFKACVEKASCADLVPSELPISNIELLLRKIVVSAVESLHSDVGMTRGIRNLRRWQLAIDEERYGEICTWPVTDYFCGVFPSSGMRQRFCHDPERLAKILIACSVRMQFNSWHYMPGHFPKASIPENRHYYYPPRMADTAIWSDQHHAGHVRAGVRFAIRSPAPLQYRKRVYHGMVDIRLYREKGVAYTRSELFQAIKYTEYVRCVSQAMADIVESTDRSIVIESFNKDWFERHSATCFDNREAFANEPAIL